MSATFNQNARMQQASEKPFPMVSVLMPIRNEEKFIANSLGAVLAQDYPPERFEVLIADGLSTDNTRNVVAQTAQEHPGVSVTIVDNPGQIVPTGLNRALQQAKGEIIVRVDGHTIVEPNYVSECVSALARTGADNVGGRMNALGEGSFGQAVMLATSSPFGVGGARFHYAEGEEWVDTVYMGAWPRAVFDRIGNFDEELVRNQDDEFSYRLRKQGGKIFLSNKIQSQYFSRSSARTLWRQYYQYGYWKVRVMQKHPSQMRLRHFAPPLLVSVVIGGALLMPWRFGRRLWLYALAVYSMANLAASLWIAAQHGLRHFRWLPATFAILHFSYGSGFLAGLVKFARRWTDKEGSRK